MWLLLDCWMTDAHRFESNRDGGKGSFVPPLLVLHVAAIVEGGRGKRQAAVGLD